MWVCAPALARSATGWVWAPTLTEPTNSCQSSNLCCPMSTHVCPPLLWSLVSGRRSTRMPTVGARVVGAQVVGGGKRHGGSWRSATTVKRWTQPGPPKNLNATSLHATASSTASGQRFYVGPACSSYSDRARGSAQATDPLARARQPSRFAWRVAQNLNATSLHATASSMASGQQFYATLSTQSYSNAPRSPRSQIRPKSGRR